LPVPGNLPTSPLKLPNRQNKSNWPKKGKFHLAFLKKTPKELKKLKNHKFDLKKPNWQPDPRTSCCNCSD